MLTKQLRRMHDNLISMQTNRKPMSKEQEELLELYMGALGME